LTRRPDIAASVFRVRAADARIAEGKAGLLPQISLTNSAGTSSNQLKDLINGNFLTWAIGSSITQNILLRDEQKERVRKMELVAQEEALNHRNIVMNAFREVENALNKSAYLSEQHKHQRSVANGTSDLLVLAKNRFDVGTGSLRELVESQNRFIESKMRLTTINKLELENRVDLHLALGGGFNPKRSNK
jgi:outer membrane protein TolC